MQQQTITCPVEIVVVNDGSSQPEYYQQWSGVKMIHLPRNTREEFGYPCAGYVRNVGIRASDGLWIAFMDDDDVWEPTKLKKQMNTGHQLVCCEGYILGTDKKKKFHQEVHGAYDFKSMPEHITGEHLRKRNIILTSSVLVSRSIINLTNGFQTDRPMGAKDGSGVYLDWEFWKELSQYGHFFFVKEPLVGYCALANQQY